MLLTKQVMQRKVDHYCCIAIAVHHIAVSHCYGVQEAPDHKQQNSIHGNFMMGRLFHNEPSTKPARKSHISVDRLCGGNSARA